MNTAVSPGRAHGEYSLLPVQPGDTVLFMATATGEAPHNAMATELLATAHSGPIDSVDCVRYESDLACLDVHCKLESRYPNDTHLTLTTREPQNIDDTRPDYISKQYVQQFLDSGEQLEAYPFNDPGSLPVRPVAERTADGARLASGLQDWNDGVSSHWSHVRIGQVRSSTEEGQTRVSVECWLDDLPADGAKVELFAESEVGELPTIIKLEHTEELPGAVNRFVFSGAITGSRSVTDFTVRVVPCHEGAFVPIKNQGILWEH